MKSLYYKGAFKTKIDEKEEGRILDSSGQFTFRGEMLKKSLCEIFNEEKGEEEKMIMHDGKLMPRSEYMKLWNKEQGDLANQTPSEKAFRNYKCKFCWYYLLQYGYSRFLGTEDWKHESPHDTFKRFDDLIWKEEPEIMSRLTEEMEKYFTDNPKEAWVDKQFFLKFLPKTSFDPIIQSMPV